MTLNLLIKPVGGSCNLHCDYCFYVDEMKNREQQYYGMMDLDTIRNIIKKTVLNASEPVSFAFQGGEPTLRGLNFFKAVVSFQKQYNHNHVPITNAIQTNGTMLNEEWCKFLHDNHFLVGLSIDGTSKTHNRYRHDLDLNDTFDDVQKKANLLTHYKVEFNILTVLTKQTALDIETIYHFYQSQGWNYQQYIPCLDPINSVHGLAKWSLTPEVYGEMLVRLFQLWYQDWKQNKQPYIRQFENWISILVGLEPEACDQRGVCGKQYSIEANGNCYPCDFFMLDNYVLGNFNQHKLKEIDLKRDELQFQKKSYQHDKKCIGCKYHALCRNGCHRMRDYNSDYDTYLNYFCPAYTYFFDHCIFQLNEVANTIRPYIRHPY